MAHDDQLDALLDVLDDPVPLTAMLASLRELTSTAESKAYIDGMAALVSIWSTPVMDE